MKDGKKEKLTISGRRPVEEALRSGQPIERIYVTRESVLSPELRDEAQRMGIPVSTVSRDKLDAVAGGGSHQGLAAILSCFCYASLEDILDKAASCGEAPLLVVAEGIEDPHNLGAIIRSAHQAGAHGIVIRERRSVPITGSVVRASAGAAFHIPIARVTNITGALEKLKSDGLWVAAADMQGASMYETDLSMPLALLVGSEGKGVSPLALSHADLRVSVPMRGRLDSLNVSVAAALIIYEALRQRRVLS